MTPDLSKLTDAALVQEVLFACVGDRGPIAQEVERRLSSRDSTPPPAPSAVHPLLLAAIASDDSTQLVGSAAWETWRMEGRPIYATPSPAPPAPAGGPVRVTRSVREPIAFDEEAYAPTAPLSAGERKAIIEAMAESAHEAWMGWYTANGHTSRLSNWGEEFMVPFSKLSEQGKELDRVIMRAILDAFDREGFRVVARTPSPAPAAPSPKPESWTTPESGPLVERMLADLESRPAAPSTEAPAVPKVGDRVRVVASVERLEEIQVPIADGGCVGTIRITDGDQLDDLPILVDLDARAWWLATSDLEVLAHSPTPAARPVPSVPMREWIDEERDVWMKAEAEAAIPEDVKPLVREALASSDALQSLSPAEYAKRIAPSVVGSDDESAPSPAPALPPGRTREWRDDEVRAHALSWRRLCDLALRKDHGTWLWAEAFFGACPAHARMFVRQAWSLDRAEPTAASPVPSVKPPPARTVRERFKALRRMSPGAPVGRDLDALIDVLDELRDHDRAERAATEKP